MDDFPRKRSGEVFYSKFQITCKNSTVSQCLPVPEIILRINKLQSVSTTFLFFIVTISHKKRIIQDNSLQISFKKENPEMENKNEKELYESHLAIYFP